MLNQVRFGEGDPQIAFHHGVKQPGAAFVLTEYFFPSLTHASDNLLHWLAKNQVQYLLLSIVKLKEQLGASRQQPQP